MIVLRWIAALFIAFVLGRLMTKIRMPAILGWLIGGMLLGPHGLALMPNRILNSGWYLLVQDVLSAAVGLMLGTELVWQKLKAYGKALIITTLTQSLGTFLVVSAAFAVIFAFQGIPVWLTGPISSTSSRGPSPPRRSSTNSSPSSSRRRASSWPGKSRKTPRPDPYSVSFNSLAVWQTKATICRFSASSMWCPAREATSRMIPPVKKAAVSAGSASAAV